MAYVEPASVLAPKASIRSVEVLYNRVRASGLLPE